MRFFEGLFQGNPDVPGHKVRAIQQSGLIVMQVEMVQAQGLVTLSFPPETPILIDGNLRQLGNNEVISATKANYYGEGMTTGVTVDGQYFKALNDPTEVKPLLVLPKAR